MNRADIAAIRGLRQAFGVWSYTLNRDPAAPPWHTWHGPIRTDSGVVRQPWLQWHDGRIVYNDGTGLVLAANVQRVGQVVILLEVLGLIPTQQPQPEVSCG